MITVTPIEDSERNKDVLYFQSTADEKIYVYKHEFDVLLENGKYSNKQLTSQLRTSEEYKNSVKGANNVY